MTTAWAVVIWRGCDRFIATDTIRRTRQDSIAAWASCWGTRGEGRREWRRLRRAGRVACVRVEVREVEG